MLPAIYLLLATAVAGRSWQHRRPITDTGAQVAHNVSRSTFASAARRLLWPAIPIALIWFILRNSPDLDPIKPLLVFLGATLRIAAGLLLVALFARWFRLLPSLIGALLLLLIAAYSAIGLVLASFAPHGPDIAFSEVERVQVIALALAYVALILLGFAISGLSRIRKAAVPEGENAGP